MGTGIHRRNTEDGPRYRLWSTASDSYCTEELTYDSLVVMLRQEAEREFARELPQRLARVNEHGSSFFDEPRDMEGPWDTERCDGPHGCGGFHHDYEPSGFAADYRLDMSPIDEAMAHEIDKVIKAGRSEHLLMGCRQCGLTRGDRGHEPPCAEGTDTERAARLHGATMRTADEMLGGG